MELVGDAVPSIQRFGPLSMISRYPAGGLVTFLGSERYASALDGARGHVVITTWELAHAVPEANAVVVTSRPPKDAFCALLEAAIDSQRFERLSSFRSPTARVHPTAHVADNVYLDDEAEVGAGAVVLPNTYVGPRARIAPNAVIGHDGFEVASGGDATRVVRHAGGVWIGEGVHVGAGACIDKGLYGDFTELGAFTQTDNLVHIAHAVRCGRRCVLAAGVVLAGWVELGDDVWLAPGTVVNQMLKIGAGAYVGTGSVVRRDVPAHALVVGHTARQIGWYCLCRSRLEPGTEEILCPNCGRRYVSEGSTIRPLG